MLERHQLQAQRTSTPCIDSLTEKDSADDEKGIIHCVVDDSVKKSKLLCGRGMDLRWIRRPVSESIVGPPETEGPNTSMCCELNIDAAL